MIEARYDEGTPALTVTGHAGSARYGRDLVCAAASILMLTLERALENKGMLGAESEKRSGYAKIICVERGESTREIFETIFAGYALLAEEWPEYVKTERTEKRRET